MLSRREFHRLAVSAVPVSLSAAKLDSKIDGVQIGVQSYSFRDMPLDAAIKGMVEIGLSECELWQGHIEPQGVPRAELQKWRTTVSMDVFKGVKTKFDDAGIKLYAYNYSFRNDFTDEEMARGFEMAKALGVSCLTASSTVPIAKRIDGFASKAKIVVGMHNHSRMTPGEFATPQSFLDAMAGNSKYIGINLDIGHFTAANFDAVAFLKKHHKRIVTLHIKDRKKNQGDNLPFGEGETPIKEVLQTLRQNRYQIPANIEYEYGGPGKRLDTLAEVKKCFAYCKNALG